MMQELVGQTSFSIQCEPETKPKFHRFCSQRRYLAKYVLKYKGVILLAFNNSAQTSQGNNL